MGSSLPGSWDYLSVQPTAAQEDSHEPGHCSPSMLYHIKKASIETVCVPQHLPLSYLHLPGTQRSNYLELFQPSYISRASSLLVQESAFEE